MGGPTYVVTHEGHEVVIAANFGNESLLIYDMDMRRLVQLGGPDVALTDFVSRIGHGEIWLVDRAESPGLYRVDFIADRIDLIPLSWMPTHVNILRTRDRLVVTDADGRVAFLDPETHTEVRTVHLP